MKQKGDLKLAIQLLDKAIDKQENFRAALLNRGTYKTRLGLVKEGIVDYKKILEFDPENTVVLFNIGNSYSMLDEHNQAVLFYTKALKTKGSLESFEISNGTPMAFQTNIDYNRFDSDNNYNKLDCEIYFERGIEYLELEKFDNAISDLNKSLKSNYKKKDCFYYIGEAYYGKNDSIKACQNFIKSAKMGDNDAREVLKEYCIQQK